ncbi:hypothetical protein [Rhizobium sp.]|jgi:hypothetical protein|uniref:hypothetical protein n=1 Tax=Rhizobium sp. TaxID=391 RepID=UPI000E93F530|nr:hypothetical protein [Rhizobium sp.]
MKVFDAQGKELMTVRKIDVEDGQLVIRGKIFGAMPMVAKLTPEEARAGLKLLGFKRMLLLLAFIFKPSRQS